MYQQGDFAYRIRRHKITKVAGTLWTFDSVVNVVDVPRQVLSRVRHCLLSSLRLEKERRRGATHDICYAARITSLPLSESNSLRGSRHRCE
jgi:hypothetical protein